MAKISKKLAAAQADAQAMVAAFRKIGLVAHATGDAIRNAMHILQDMGDLDGVDCMIAEEERRASARRSVMAVLAGIPA